MKRHNNSEITLKLRQADDMAARGQTQAQICKSLGVSVMTFHRWRKVHGEAATAEAKGGDQLADVGPDTDAKSAPAREVSVRDLIEENRRLKKIVTDLLLEKMKLEEASEVGVRSFREPQHRSLPRNR